jgi:hypothetical protein
MKSESLGLKSTLDSPELRSGAETPSLVGGDLHPLPYDWLPTFATTLGGGAPISTTFLKGLSIRSLNLQLDTRFPITIETHIVLLSALQARPSAL